MQDDALFLDLFSNQSSLIKRLAGAFREAAREFVEDPAGYLVNAFKDYQASNARRRDRLRLGLAIGLFVYATLFVAMLVLWTLHARHAASATAHTDLTVFHLSAIQPPEAPPAKSDKPDQGGGGGGNHEITPASQGVPPPFVAGRKRICMAARMASSLRPSGKPLMMRTCLTNPSLPISMRARTTPATL